MANWNVVGESSGFILGKSDRCGIPAAASFLYKSITPPSSTQGLEQDRTRPQVRQNKSFLQFMQI